MICNWGKKEFLQQQKALLKLIEEESNPDKKDYLTAVYEMTESIIVNYFDVTSSFRRYIHNEVINLIDHSISYRRYYSVISQFYSDVKTLEGKMDELDKLIDEKDDGSGSLNIFGETGETTVVSALAHTETFFKTIDPDLYNLFLEVEKNSFVSCTEKRNKLLNENTEGITTFIDGVRATFISLLDTKDAKIYENLVHEYGHAIKNIICPQALYTEEIDFFDEIPSIFLELLALEKNIPQYPQASIEYLKYATLSSYYSDAEVLDSHQHISHQLKAFNYRLNPLFFYRLKKEDNIGLKAFFDSLHTHVSSDGSYIFSYITALELLHIYREDPKKALELFKQLLFVEPSFNYLREINSIIPLNVHAKEESERIIDTLTLSLKR